MTIVLYVLCVLMLIGVVVLFKAIKKMSVAQTALDEMILNFIDVAQNIFNNENKAIKNMQVLTDNMNRIAKEMNNLKVVVNKMEKSQQEIGETSKNLKELSNTIKKASPILNHMNTNTEYQKKLLAQMSSRVNEMSRLIHKK